MPEHAAWWTASLLFEWLPILLVLALAAAIAWALIAPETRPRHEQLAPNPLPQTPLEVLRTRYALGEIDTVTFEQTLERLLASEQWTPPHREVNNANTSE